jgi:SOS-response transcriptional repressor LexA
LKVNSTPPVESPEHPRQSYQIPQLTELELQAVRFIERQKLSEGYPPSIREIGDELHLSQASAQRLVNRLILKRAIERAGKNMPRALTVICALADLERAVA